MQDVQENIIHITHSEIKHAVKCSRNQTGNFLDVIFKNLIDGDQFLENLQTIVGKSLVQRENTLYQTIFLFSITVAWIQR